ncbi:nitrogenase subunit alpha [Methanobrevibacter filiformis]|uniref:Nitrogenase protein alpha chain n=1 Tax=Methanobrevibacter filiformis TaxID=55758 RepID=A0A166ETA0_9EURY|nr:nitrogenase subunit alpha [Methanobrevibacter filiformis]KZX16990.1 nitrogenase vanadium-iron protein alpha chain [Methanobrevibacter filiformis]
MPHKLFDVDKEIPERKEHVYVKHCNDVEDDIACNTSTVPGCMTARGCVYAGSKGVIGGAIKDVIQVVHSPCGCTTYGGGAKRYPSRPNMPDGSTFPIENFNIKYVCGTDLKESDVVFGGTKKLKQSIIDANKEFPFATSIYCYATCTTGLIGDDMDAVAKELTEELGKDVVAFNTPGFAGPSQSKGHHIANNTIFDRLVGTKEPPRTTEYDVCLIGEYNIDGDLWIIEKYLKEMGINVLSRFTGDSSHDEICWMHRSKLNLVRCQRSATYIAELIEEKYGTPFMKVDFFSVEYCADNLREIGKFFNLEEEAEKVIKKYLNPIKEELAFYKEKLTGKKIYIFSGGPKSWHLSTPIERELGMDVTAVASEFEHADGFKKMKERVKEGATIVDDPNTPEIEEMILNDKPDIILAGIKEKYLAHKLGVPSLMIHSYENGPYIGFEGFLNMAKDIYAYINTPVWSLLEFNPKPEVNKEEISSNADINNNTNDINDDITDKNAMEASK